MGKAGFRLAALVLAALPAFASGLNYDCATVGAGALPSNVCTILQTTVAGEYASTFTNANAYIYVQYGGPAGDVASNEQVYNTVSYLSYYNALTSHESGTNDVTAVSSLNTGISNPVISGQGIAVTSALSTALGLAARTYGVTASGSVCNTIGSPTNANGCYNDVISVSSTVSFYYDGITAGFQTSSEYDFFGAVEHETNEALGTSSCLTNGTESSGCANGGQGISAADLFRYAYPGTRSYSSYDGTAAGSLAYFSINKGAVDIAPYNNSPNGADYGDWATTCTYIQDAFGCLGAGAGITIQNDGGVEIAALDAVGYNLTSQGLVLSAATAPEPGTIVTLASGIGLLCCLAWRRRNSPTDAGGRNIR